MFGHVFAFRTPALLGFQEREDKPGRFEHVLRLTHPAHGPFEVCLDSKFKGPQKPQLDRIIEEAMDKLFIFLEEASRKANVEDADEEDEAFLEYLQGCVSVLTSPDEVNDAQAMWARESFAGMARAKKASKASAGLGPFPGPFGPA